jgi:hypothetical protein
MLTSFDFFFISLLSVNLPVMSHVVIMSHVFSNLSHNVSCLNLTSFCRFTRNVSHVVVMSHVFSTLSHNVSCLTLSHTLSLRDNVRHYETMWNNVRHYETLWDNVRQCETLWDIVKKRWTTWDIDTPVWVSSCFYNIIHFSFLKNISTATRICDLFQICVHSE